MDKVKPPLLTDSVILFCSLILLTSVPFLRVGEVASWDGHPQPDAGRVSVVLPAGIWPANRADQQASEKNAEWLVPHLCLSRGLFNVDCPGCGLTRSTLQTLQGHWWAGLEHHRWGWLVALILILQIPYRSLKLAGNPLLRQEATHQFLAHAWNYGLPLVAFLTILEWIIRTAWHQS